MLKQFSWMVLVLPVRAWLWAHCVCNSHSFWKDREWSQMPAILILLFLHTRPLTTCSEDRAQSWKRRISSGWIPVDHLFRLLHLHMSSSWVFGWVCECVSRVNFSFIAHDEDELSVSFGEWAKAMIRTLLTPRLQVWQLSLRPMWSIWLKWMSLVEREMIMVHLLWCKTPVPDVNTSLANPPEERPSFSAAGSCDRHKHWGLSPLF